MTTQIAKSALLDPGVELELIKWRQARFERITVFVEDALPQLMADIDETVASMSSFAVSKAQVAPETLMKELFAPWALEVATRVEADLEKELDALTALLSETGTSRDALRSALPALASVGVLAASLSAIPTVISLATVTGTSFFFLTTTTLSWPLFAVGGAGLAVATLAGGRVIDGLSNRNRAHLSNRLQRRTLTAALGYGLGSGERCLVTDLQAFALRSLEAEMGTS